MIERADEAVLRSLVGHATFERGRAYARQGRVLLAERRGDTVEGEVQGSRARPYEVTVVLRRGAEGRLSGVDGACTCPVGWYCKHVVAVALAALGDDGRRAEAPPPETDRPARPAGWEERLAPILAGGGREPPASPSIGLQFEVADHPAPRAGLPAPHASIVMRPVVPGRSGRWVRTGVSWSELAYFHHRWRGPRTDQVVVLLEELLAMCRGRDYWMRDPVRLESIPSRRVWDLLAQLQDLGAPLVLAGPAGGAVRLMPPAEIVLDVTRQRDGLQLEADYSCNGTPLPDESRRLVGQPPHGIAWWEGRPGGPAAALMLAPFLPFPTPEEHGLVSGGTIGIPRAQAPRFLEEVIPRVRRRITVTSTDGSVELANLPDLALILTARHRPEHRVELEWHRGVPGGWREELGEAGFEPGLDRAARAAAEVVSKLPALTGPGGRDLHLLAPRATVSGMAAVVLTTELLPRLREIPGLSVEEDGEAPDYRAASEAPLVSLGGGPSADGDWFDLEVEVSVGGEPVVFHDLFLALATGQSHLILPSGTYFSLDVPALAELARLIEEGRDLRDSPSGLVRVSRVQAGLWEDLARLGVLSAQAEAWEASVRALIDAPADTTREVPDTLAATLRPYQVEGFRWLAFLHDQGLGGILADDMGLGKTLQALALVSYARAKVPDSPFLVVAPTSVVGNWVSECHRFAPHLSAAAVRETTARRGVPISELAAGADVVVTSYALFRLDYAEYEAQRWGGVFLDEAQFAKNSASHNYRRARSLPVPFKVAMTGTPLENNLMELWSLLSITAPGLFPQADRFNEYYRVPIERGLGAERLGQLRRRMRPLMLRRTKEQVAADLPDKQEQVLELDLVPGHRRVYSTYLQRERQKVLGLLEDLDRNRLTVLRSLTLLRQASLAVSLVDEKHARVPSTKLDALLPMLEEVVADGHRVLVFSQFTRFLGLARQRIRDAGIEHCYLDGRTRRRAEVIGGFREGKAPVFLVSLKAGGFGLNLTEADYCILLDPWWNPATEAQAVDRVHRIGQTRKVMVYRLVARDTIEEKVMALKARKAALFDSVIDGGGFESAALTAEDIRQLLTP